MKRDILTLWEKEFDVVVVGAGVYGACIALTLSQAGYSVALIEKNDFGAGTSANSLGILHGGLRYLQHFNIKRMRRSIRSRRFFMQISPHLIDIVSFKLPLKGKGIKSPLAMRVALALNDLISHSRNQGLESNLKLPNGKVARPDNDKQGWFSQVKGFNGVGIWSEAVVRHTERLVLNLVQSAYLNGAQVTNYCAGEQIQIENNQLSGLTARDLINKQTGLIKTKWVIDTCGYSSGDLRDEQPSSHTGKWARAVNAVVKGELVGDAAIALSVRDQLKDSRNLAQKDERMLFFVPHERNTLIGTFYDHAQATKAGLRLSEGEKKQFIENINRCHPNLELSEADILYWHSGWLPTTGLGDHLELESKSSTKLHRYDASSGLLEVRGVKFTTAPEVAKDILRLIIKHFPIATSETKPSSKSPNNFQVEFGQTHYARYGEDSAFVNNYIHQDETYLTTIRPDLLIGEVYYVCEYEMVQHLSDIVLRRFSFEISEKSLHQLAEDISHIAQKKLEWSEERRQLELKDTNAQIALRCQVK